MWSGLTDPVTRWRRRRGYAPFPKGMDFLLTDDCNLRCQYCPRSDCRSEGGQAPAYMDTGSMLKLVDQVAAFAPWIRLIGGEPFLHPEWPRLVGRAAEHGMWCASVTNGLANEALAEDLVSSGLRILGVSIDGPQEIHDKIRGQGTYQRIIDGITAVRRVKARRGSELPLIEIYVTVHAANQHVLVDFAEELAAFQIWKFRAQQLVWASSTQIRDSRALIHSAVPGAEFFPPELTTSDQPSGVNAQVLCSQFAALRERSFPFIVEIHPDLPFEEWHPYHTETNYYRPKDRPCHSMGRYVYIDPHGRVHPCLPLDMGNTFELPFARVYNGRRFRAFRRLVSSHGRLPLCHRCPD